jgi:nitroreductase
MGVCPKTRIAGPQPRKTCRPPQEVEMELYDVMRTTFAAREFEPEPIPEEVLHKILDNARFAPSGGNRQGWRVISVRDSNNRERLVELMKPTAQKYIAQRRAGENPWNTLVPTRLSREEIEATEVPASFLRALAFAPTLLLISVDLRVVASFDDELDRVGVISGASIYPFVWNILLSARTEGYGGTLTTFAAASEDGIRKLFGIPEYMAICGLLPMGKPIKQLTRLKRNPVEEFAWHDVWEGEPIR